jgi:glutaredoxin
MKEKMLARLQSLRRVLLYAALTLALTLFALDRYAAFAYVPTADSTRIAIYTTEWCPYCKRLRADLQASGVPYTEIDVEKTLAGQLAFWALHARGVPVSVIGPTVVYGYRVDEIARALATLGYDYAVNTDLAPRDPPHSPALSPTKRLGFAI